jgi:hypothetical protein
MALLVNCPILSETEWGSLVKVSTGLLQRVHHGGPHDVRHELDDRLTFSFSLFLVT